MGFIYKITNKINGKVYIGQTITPIKNRMYKHYSQARNGKNITGIDAAIKKYGEENFEVEQILECPNEDLDLQEKFYISKYNSFENGYNLTIGGQLSTTSLNININEAISKYQELKSVEETAKYFNCCSETMSKLLKVNGVEIKKHLNLDNLKNGCKFKEGDNAKAVKIIELNLTFNSLKDCAQWLLDNGYSKAKNMELTRKSLSRALNRERASYCGLHFEFAEVID